MDISTINSDDGIDIHEEEDGIFKETEQGLFNKNFKFDDFDSVSELGFKAVEPNMNSITRKSFFEKDIYISTSNDTKFVQNKIINVDKSIEDNLTSDDEILSNNGDVDMQDENVSSKKDSFKDISRKVPSKSHQNSFFDESFEKPSKSLKSFIELSLSREIIKALTDMNIHEPTMIQSAAIPIGLSGRDICACAKTGSGKTMAFLVPIFERLLLKQRSHNITRILIIEPTRELAFQVFNVAKKLSYYTEISIALATGGVENKTQQIDLKKNPDIIIATPGRLIDHLYNSPSFTLQSIEVLVLDEADRLLDDSFTDQVKEIVRLSSSFRQTLLFSATMTDKVEDLVLLSLNKPIKLFIDSNLSTVSTLQQEFIKIKPNQEDNRMAILLSLCHRNFHENCLAFFPTKHMVHKARVILELFKLKVAELHGNLSQYERTNALDLFKNKKVDILVATDLASRGLDIDDIKTVINYSMPASIKEYIHRVGRTARVGKNGRSITLVGEEERKMLKQLLKSSCENTMKSRIVSHEIIEFYQNKIELLNEKINSVLKDELVERELKIVDRNARKVENLIKFKDEIMSRPKKKWLKTNHRNKKNIDASDNNEIEKPKKLTKSEKLKEMNKQIKEIEFKKQKDDARYTKSFGKFKKNY